MSIYLHENMLEIIVRDDRDDGNKKKYTNISTQ